MATNNAVNQQQPVPSWFVYLNTTVNNVTGAAADSVYIGNGSVIIPVTKGQLLTMYVGVDGASLTTDIGTNSYFMGTYCL
jgi:hypothetical protein